MFRYLSSFTPSSKTSITSRSDVLRRLQEINAEVTSLSTSSSSPDLSLPPPPPPSNSESPPSNLSTLTLKFISTATSIYDNLTTANSFSSVIASHSHVSDAITKLTELHIILQEIEFEKTTTWPSGTSICTALNDYVATVKSTISRSQINAVQTYMKSGKNESGEDVTNTIAELVTLVNDGLVGVEVFANIQNIIDDKVKDIWEVYSGSGWDDILTYYNDTWGRSVCGCLVIKGDVIAQGVVKGITEDGEKVWDWAGVKGEGDRKITEVEITKAARKAEEVGFKVTFSKKWDEASIMERVIKKQGARTFGGWGNVVEGAGGMMVSEGIVKMCQHIHKLKLIKNGDKAARTCLTYNRALDAVLSTTTSTDKEGGLDVSALTTAGCVRYNSKQMVGKMCLEWGYADLTPVYRRLAAAEAKGVMEDVVCGIGKVGSRRGEVEWTNEIEAWGRKCKNAVGKVKEGGRGVNDDVVKVVVNGVKEWGEEIIWELVYTHDVSLEEGETLGRVGRNLGWESGICGFMDLGLDEIEERVRKGIMDVKPER